MGEKMTPTLDGKLRCLQSLLQQMGASVACKTVGEARDALLTAHLTQPAQACEHDWAEGYGVPAYCKHCGVARVAQPAQAVDVEKGRFALNDRVQFNNGTHVFGGYVHRIEYPHTIYYVQLDDGCEYACYGDDPKVTLTAALPNANGKEG